MQKPSYKNPKGEKQSSKKNISKKRSVQKPKTKPRQNSKQTKAQIEKLNQDLSTISQIHITLSKQGPAPKEINVLDASSLREGMAKDEKSRVQSEKAETDLAAQLELITGMAL